jgi:hypothetical protein
VNSTYTQPFEVKVVGTNVLLANSGLDEPIVCDNRAAYSMSVNDAIAANIFTAAEISGAPTAAPTAAPIKTATAAPVADLTTAAPVASGATAAPVAGTSGTAVPTTNELPIGTGAVGATDAPIPGDKGGDNTMYFAVGGAAVAGMAGLAVAKSRMKTDSESERMSDGYRGNMPSQAMVAQNSQWRGVTDPQTGKPYYHNVVTDETSWTAPNGFVDL